MWTCVAKSLNGSKFVEQIGVAIQQLDQGQRRLGLAVFVARESIDAAAEKFSGLTLVKIELAAREFHLGSDSYK